MTARKAKAKATVYPRSAKGDTLKGKGGYIRYERERMPERHYEFYVYILSSRSRNLYVGMTSDLRVRVLQHRAKPEGTHTAHYEIHRLVYFERFQYVRSAIAREKEMKSWTRVKKVALIEKVNPTWEDLGEGF